MATNYAVVSSKSFLYLIFRSGCGEGSIMTLVMLIPTYDEVRRA